VKGDRLGSASTAVQPEAAQEIDMPSIAYEKDWIPAHIASNDPPRVEIDITWSERSRFWSLTVTCCPFCYRRHSHGGGDGEVPDLGFRLSHCVDRPSGTYELVAGAESGWAA
jgi:hypothetical protein